MIVSSGSEHRCSSGRADFRQLSDKITFWRENTELAQADRIDLPLNLASPSSPGREALFYWCFSPWLWWPQQWWLHLVHKEGQDLGKTKCKTHMPPLSLIQCWAPHSWLPETLANQVSQPEVHKMQMISVIVLKWFSVHIRTNIIKSEVFWIWSHCSICSSLCLTCRSISIK